MKCIDDEIPFEVPETWKWCRLRNLILGTGAGKSPNCDKRPKKDNEWGVLTTTAIQYCDFLPNENKVLPTNYIVNEDQEVKYNDLLITRAGPRNRTGVVCVANKAYSNLILSDKTVRIEYVRDYCNPYYLMFALNSPVIHDNVMSATVGMADSQVNISQNSIQNIAIPLPPYKEQENIVNKLNTVLPYLKKYSIVKEQQDKLNENISILLKKSILQEAIQGKLVPQDPNDEPASVLLERIKEEKAKLFKDGKLKKKDLMDSVIFKGEDNKYYEKIGSQVTCIDDEIPFEIPTSWVWVRLEQLCTYIQRGKSPKYSEIRKYPVVAQKCNQWTGFSLEKALFLDPATIGSYGEERFLQDGDLLWNSTGLGTLGRMAIYDTSKNEYGLAVADSHVTVIRAIPSMVSSEYLFKYFSSHTVQSVIEDKSEGSTKQKELATSTVKSYMVPLPPYEEQLRIVAVANNVIASIMR